MRANTGWIRSGKKIFQNALILAVVGIGSALYAQDLGGTLEQLPEDAAKEFVRPLTDAFGANLNTGLLGNAAKASVLGLDFKLGLVFMGAFIDKDQAIFVLLDQFFPLTRSQAELVAQNIAGFSSLPASEQEAILNALTSAEGIQLKSTTTGPTIFGSEDNYVKVTIPAQQIEVGGKQYSITSEAVIELNEVQGLLQDPGIFPTLAPQLSLGTLYGTQATVRFLPKIKISDEIGKLSYLAVGVQHNPLVWFANPLPVDLSLAFFYQNLKIEDLAKATSTAYGINVSKTFGGFIASFTPYAGFMLEKTETDIDYEFYPIPGGPPITFDFTIESANKNRFILGMGLNLFGVNLLADYNFSKVNTLNLSVLYGF